MLGADPVSQAKKWMLIGAFQQVKSVFIFTDSHDSYNSVLYQMHSKVFILYTADASEFNFEDALSEWSGF